MSRRVERRPRRILFATVDSNWAGAQAQMLELAAGLPSDELEPVVLTTGGGGLIDRSLGARIRTHVLPYSFMRRHFPVFPYYTFGPAVLRWILYRERIALVHTHCPNSAVPIMNASRGLDLPLVAHVHDFDQRWVTNRTLPVLNGGRSMVVAVSDACARHVIELGVHPAHVRRIYNGVHLLPQLTGARERARAELGARQDEIVVLLVGRLVRRKGAADLLHALTDPRLKDVPLRAFFVGGAEAAEPRFREELARLALDLGISGRVELCGEREDAAALHAGCDIAAVPARREAFGRVVVEAMHAGVPVVAYRDGALPELVRDNQEGLLVPPGDIGALSDALVLLATSSSLRARLGAAGHGRAREFGHAPFVDRVAQLYAEMLIR